MAAHPRGIGATLFLAFAAAALPALVVAGLLLESQARGALERELGRRAEALATAISTAIPEATWRLAFSLGPGEEESRTAGHLRSRLESVRRSTGAERVAAWRLDGRLLVDSRTVLPIDLPAPRAALLRNELDRVAAGRATSTPLYHTAEGRAVKLGLAPIGGAEGGSLGALVVEAPSHSLGVVRAMRRTLLASGFAGLLFVLGAALVVSRALTRRIGRLVSVARRMEVGDLETIVPALGEDELGALAGALEAMRGAVKLREHHLRAMLGGVAHEIRNPLGGLLLYAEMLSRDPGLSDEQSGRAARILAEGVRLEKVVEEFLAFARPERPRGAWVPLAAVLEESSENARVALDWRGALELPDTAARVWSDEGHLRQILLNLLRNAMDAAGAGGRVRLALEPQPTGGSAGGAGADAGGEESWIVHPAMPAGRAASEARGMIDVLVEDSGSGIVPAERAQVFEPFYSSRAQGAGLGLAIVRRLCELNAIAVAIGESPLGGARLRLRLSVRTEG
ncbi:MAG: HAMP domain-containing histidine kinase [Candidatus Eisenbacteria sp.]|nr:HAMP domain-containing histidine kinase [Candidatus Eisenbacteria bacterium]